MKNTESGSPQQATVSLDYSLKAQTRSWHTVQCALGLSQQHLCVLTGLLTGHVTINRHLAVMKIRTDPVC